MDMLTEGRTHAQVIGSQGERIGRTQHGVAGCGALSE